MMDYETFYFVTNFGCILPTFYLSKYRIKLKTNKETPWMQNCIEHVGQHKHGWYSVNVLNIGISNSSFQPSDCTG